MNDVNASYRRCFDKIQSAFDTNTETDSNTFLLNGLESLRKNIKAYKGSLEAVSIGSEHPLLIVNLDSLVEDLDSITNPDE